MMAPSLCARLQYYYYYATNNLPPTSQPTNQRMKRRKILSNWIPSFLPSFHNLIAFLPESGSDHVTTCFIGKLCATWWVSLFVFRSPIECVGVLYDYKLPKESRKKIDFTRSNQSQQSNPRILCQKQWRGGKEWIRYRSLSEGSPLPLSVPSRLW